MIGFCAPTQNFCNLVGEIDMAVGTLETGTQQNAAMVEVSAAVCNEPSTEGSALDDMLSGFKIADHDVAEVSGSEAVAHPAEAQRRIGAVSLVHRRLYGGASVEVVDLAHHLKDLASSLADGWREHIPFDLVPVLISADRAVPVG